MVTTGTLLFLAEVDRISRHRGGNGCFHCTYPNDKVVEQVLQQVGILDLLRLPARHPESSFPDNVRHWRFAAGELVEGAKFESVKAGMEGKVTPALLSGFYAGITEAMSNSVHHAYADDRGDGLSNEPHLRRWWMFSQERNGSLSVAFCDTGIGIPRSLSDGSLESQTALATILRTLGLTGTSDAELIRGAMELRKSSTGSPRRGYGLAEIRDVISTAARGRLLIHSNCGMYRYSGEDAKETLQTFADSILGTIILWQVPLIEGEGLANDN